MGRGAGPGAWAKATDQVVRVGTPVVNQQLNPHIHRVNLALVWAQICRRKGVSSGGVCNLDRIGIQEGHKK